MDTLQEPGTITAYIKAFSFQHFESMILLTECRCN